MGNCLFGGFGEANQEIVKVAAPNGGVMEFYAPIAVRTIADEFPGHGVFRAHDLFWNPLPLHEELVAGESYYLLPYNVGDRSKSRDQKLLLGNEVVREGHVRSTSIPSSLVAPYRMSLDYQGALKRSYTEVFSRDSGKSNNGVWKVKLVICPEQLLEILSQECRTQELIESVRAVVKCGNSPAPGGFSDQWSLPSSASRSGFSKTEGVVDI
ncbi:uncharacterized protein LOC104444109 [Eucalyptus grandis]|uniref:Uncharacterized protein n=3 Tax=Eucalyptus TaxID=3932 RepID=A0ACC3KTR4_EUCGR|nr:uncharacterized protein LOC104444109 [Eucalyptus grandis]KAK3429545.1 hypothetical protein EUGRSUZ_E01054 [Eucalyptus grandis]